LVKDHSINAFLVWIYWTYAPIVLAEEEEEDDGGEKEKEKKEEES
jgi:hypothetical protein